MIDLSPMKKVKIDPKAKTAYVEPGVTLGEFDAEAQKNGLATPLGINSTTGVAGFTLGGGFGWISRKYGLTVDNLISVDIVTADGKLISASEKENPDLFWAVRGGGGNFGVVTAFEFRLHPVGPEVLSGLIIHPFAQAKTLLPEYRRLVASLPEEISAWVVMRKAPPLPFLPPEVHGKEILIFAVCAVGDMKKAEKALEPLRALGKPIADVIGPHPFVGWQQALDPLLTPGARNYWKSHDFKKLDDGLFDAMIDAVNKLPSDETEIVLVNLGGAVNKVAANATAYPHRDVEFIINVHTRWREAAQDKDCIGWARGFFDASAKFATGGVYVNFMPEDETQRVAQGAYGVNYERLAKLKAKYDPQNLFRMNQNIKPAA
jgi:FAD/FMN-containing dehydrogenase